jgi:hypothetical protein
MLLKVFTLQINSKQDMVLLEKALGRLLGSEFNKCSLVRSQEFINIRLRALYDRGPADRIVAYGERVKVCLEVDKTADIFLMESSMDDGPSLLGKRSSLEEEDPLCDQYESMENI